MDSPNESLTHTRLMEASDAVLTAIREVIKTSGQKSGSGLSVPYPPNMVGSPIQPDCLKGFSRFEVEEATAFLLRLGFIHPRSAKA